jgi:hypothetical protein
MDRNDTLRAIAARCRASHGATLFSLGWVLLDQPSETLDDLLVALQEFDQGNELLGHLDRYKALRNERYGRSSRLD